MFRKLKWQIPGEPLAARYNWRLGPVPGRGPAVEKHWLNAFSYFLFRRFSVVKSIRRSASKNTWIRFIQSLDPTVEGERTRTSGVMTMGPIGCPETSVRNYHYLLRDNPEERSSHLFLGGSLKSRIGQGDTWWWIRWLPIMQDAENVSLIVQRVCEAATSPFVWLPRHTGLNFHEPRS